MGKARKNLGLGLVCISFLFLFNPVLAVIDILPDFIGYLLLCIGISQLADMNYHFEESLRYFKRMLVVSIIQMFSVFLLFGLVTGRERPTAILLFTFTFAVVEVIFLAHAYNQFFEGFLYLGSRMETSTVFHTEAQLLREESRRLRAEKRLKKMNKRRLEKRRPPLRSKPQRPFRSNTSRAASFTLLFVVLKAILTVLPEFSALVEQSYNESARFVFLYDFIGLYRSVAFVIVIAFGLSWLIKMIRYVRSIIKDRPFMQALTDKYVSEVEPKTYIFIQRAIKLAFIVLSIGAVFSIDFYIDGNSILPDFLCPLILIAALILLRKFVKIPIKSYFLCGLYTITSTVTYVLSAIFYSNYTLSLSNIRLEAYQVFQDLSLVKIVDSVVFFFLILCLFPVLSEIIKTYTGFSPVSGANVQMQEKIKYVHGMLHKKLRIFLILAALCSLSGVCYILLVKHLNFIWIVDFLVCLIFSVYTITTLNAICEEVQYKYLLD